MSVEIWILILLVLGASAGSAWLAYSMARRGAPSQAQLDALDENPLLCEDLAVIQAGVAQGRAALQQRIIIEPFFMAMACCQYCGSKYRTVRYSRRL